MIRWVRQGHDVRNNSLVDADQRYNCNNIIILIIIIIIIINIIVNIVVASIIITITNNFLTGRRCGNVAPLSYQ